jgi:ATP-dependent DNA helicase RecG
MPEIDQEALDVRAASESFALVRRLTRRDMETLHRVRDHQGRLVPTVGGMLLDSARNRVGGLPKTAAWD